MEERECLVVLQFEVGPVDLQRIHKFFGKHFFALTDGSGKTPLALVEECGYQDIIKILTNFSAILANQPYGSP